MDTQSIFLREREMGEPDDHFGLNFYEDMWLQRHVRILSMTVG